ncbi:uncharacterized protein RSE6_06753 [Rhynchosporium secalis]|uniref:Uncharacterized protein n=1 Tax=Rhynchosporium secalis TaxID=38038 RepID=A0A1E1MB87_RHYSE|nr:uncharacterized protein RSE6_06753 [Rhynchosporium secalis]
MAYPNLSLITPPSTPSTPSSQSSSPSTNSSTPTSSTSKISLAKSNINPDAILMIEDSDLETLSSHPPIYSPNHPSPAPSTSSHTTPQTHERNSCLPCTLLSPRCSSAFTSQLPTPTPTDTDTDTDPDPCTHCLNPQEICIRDRNLPWNHSLDKHTSSTNTPPCPLPLLSPPNSSPTDSNPNPNPNPNIPLPHKREQALSHPLPLPLPRHSQGRARLRRLETRFILERMEQSREDDVKMGRLTEMWVQEEEGRWEGRGGEGGAGGERGEELVDEEFLRMGECTPSRKVQRE